MIEQTLAVILKDPLSPALSEVKDSKELTESKREQLFDVVTNNSISYSIIEITPQEIDKLGLHKCNIEGMRRAVNGLKISPEYVLTDGYAIPGLTTPNLSVWKGDQVAISISAASILAKVYRDRIMIDLDKIYPNYGLASHKGYITALHTELSILNLRLSLRMLSLLVVRILIGPFLVKIFQLRQLD